MKTSKTAVVLSAIWGKVMIVAGIFCLIVVLGIVILLVDPMYEGDEITDEVAIATLIFFGILTIAAFRKGFGNFGRIRRFRKYVSLISVQNITSIDLLAGETGKSASFVKKDLRKMIKKGFFANASISTATNEIIIGGRTSTGPNREPDSGRGQAHGAEREARREMEVFTCNACGASGTKQKGVMGKCEYCDSAVK